MTLLLLNPLTTSSYVACFYQHNTKVGNVVKSNNHGVMKSFKDKEKSIVDHHEGPSQVYLIFGVELVKSLEEIKFECKKKKAYGLNVKFQDA
jgi:hypothetical protein